MHDHVLTKFDQNDRPEMDQIKIFFKQSLMQDVLVHILFCLLQIIL